MHRAADVADLQDFDEVIIATGVRPRDPQIESDGRANVISYVDLLSGQAEAGQRVAVIGAGGIGFDVAEYLVEPHPSPTMRPDDWLKEWGITDPATTRGGLTSPAPERPARAVTLMQRKPEKPGRGPGEDHGLDPPGDPSGQRGRDDWRRDL